jgi:hypothetical protein
MNGIRILGRSRRATAPFRALGACGAWPQADWRTGGHRRSRIRIHRRQRDHTYKDHLRTPGPSPSTVSTNASAHSTAFWKHSGTGAPPSGPRPARSCPPAWGRAETETGPARPTGTFRATPSTRPSNIPAQTPSGPPRCLAARAPMASSWARPRPATGRDRNGPAAARCTRAARAGSGPGAGLVARATDLDRVTHALTGHSVSIRHLRADPGIGWEWAHRIHRHRPRAHPQPPPRDDTRRRRQPFVRRKYV